MASRRRATRRRPSPAVYQASQSHRQTSRFSFAKPRHAPAASPMAASQDLASLSSNENYIVDCAADVNVEEIYMALEMKANGTVGCAYFVSASSTLYLYEDMRIAGLELVESLLFQVQPTSITVPSRSPEKLMDLLEKLSRLNSDVDAAVEESRGFVLRSVVSSDFNPDYGRRGLARPDGTGTSRDQTLFFTTAVEEIEWHVRGSDAEAHQSVGVSEQNKLMLLGTLVNLDGQVSLGCAGALIRDIERRAAASPSAERKCLGIRNVQTITYDNCMFIAADALLSLQIFRPDHRQGSVRDTTAYRTDNASSASQDKRSIFDLFHSLALTSQGRSRLKEIFTRPSTDLETIDERHNTITGLLDPDNNALVGTLWAALKKTKNIQPILTQLRRGLCLPGDLSSVKQGAWASLKDFCCSLLQLVDTYGSWPRSCSIIKKALRDIDPEAISRVKESLARTIDFQVSRDSGRGVVASGVIPELDAIKSTYGHLQGRLENICQEYKARSSDEAQGDIVGCVFHPQRGYLLVAAAILQERDDGIMEAYNSDVDLSLDAREDALLEDGLMYFKTSGLRAIDREFGDLAGRIIDLEVEIFHTLGQEVLENEDALLGASRAVGEVDSILALANGAKTLRLSRPLMTADNVLHVHGGRHLLQELGPWTFVPNDCLLGGGDGHGMGEAHYNSNDTDALPTAIGMPSVVVLTGPNHSGKSVYLKQVATIVFLAHIGSFVPAEEALIGITDKILTRISTRESVSRDESAFGVDLRQAAFSINLATRRSLVLLDEFGKGTATADGAALLDALLWHFLRLGPGEAPKVLAATHFHEIFERKSFKQHPRLGLFHMKVTVNPAASRPEDRVGFLHELREGRSTESFGCHCAAISGVPSAVIDRATQISGLLGKGVGLSRVCLQALSGSIGELQGNEDRARLFLTAMAQALESCSMWQAPREILQHVFSREDL